MLYLAPGFWDTPVSTALGHHGSASHLVAPSPGARISILPACSTSPPQAFGRLTVAREVWCCKEVVALLRKLLCQGLEDVWGWVPLKERGLGWGTRGLSMTTVGNDELHGNFLPSSWRGCRAPVDGPEIGIGALGSQHSSFLVDEASASLLRSQQPEAGPPFRAGLLPAASVCASPLSSADPMSCGLSALSSGESVPCSQPL